MRELSAVDWVSVMAAPLAIATAGGAGNALELTAPQSAVVLSVAAGLTTVPLAHEIVPYVVGAKGNAKLAAVAGLVLGFVLMMLSARMESAADAGTTGNTGTLNRPPAAVAKLAQGTPIEQLQLRDLNSPDSAYPATAVLASAFDVFIDGVITGTTVGAGNSGIPLAAALALENGALSMAMSEHLKEKHASTGARLGTTAGLTMSSVLGTMAGLLGGEKLKRDGNAYAGLMGFAMVLVLWLVTQTLLPEAQKVPGHRLTSATAYFAGIGSALGLEWLAG